MAAFSASSVTLDSPTYRFRETVSGAFSGRSLVAARPIRRGEVVLSEECCTFAPAPALVEVCCNYCGLVCTGQTLYRVSSEDVGRYCSQHCITIDYELHKIEMDTLSKLAPIWADKLGNEIFRTIVRVACMKKVSGSYGTAQSAPNLGRGNSFSEIMTLEAATGLLSKSAIDGVRSLAESFSKALRSSSDVRLPASEVERLMFIIQCNAHKVVMEDDTKMPIGLGLFPMTCMMNHSCLPNCAHRFIISPQRPPQLVMQAICDIAEGEELCYSYVPMYQSTSRRREQLRTAYSFDCSCPRCLDDALCASDVYIDNADPEDGGRERAVKEIEVCIGLAQSDNASRIAMSLKKLLGTLADPAKVSRFHVWFKSLLHAYISVAKSAISLLSMENTTGFAAIIGEDILRDLPVIALSFGALAAGCISRFTKVASVEIGECCELMLKAARRLPTENITKSSFSNTVCNSLEKYLPVDSEEVCVIIDHFDSIIRPSSEIIDGIKELCRINFETRMAGDEIRARI